FSVKTKIKIKYYFVFFVILISIIFAWFITHPLNVTVKTTQKVFTADEFVEIQATLSNRSFLPSSTFWGTCGESYDIFVDGESVDTVRGQCEIGAGHLLGFQKYERTFRLDLSESSPGEHTFYFVFDDIR